MPKIRIIKPSIKALPTRKRVAAYARVSMETERLHHSLSAQVSYYSNLIQHNPDWIYAGVYADEGFSGTQTERRAEFQRMIEDCEAGKIDIILTKSISRFARNTVDLLNTIRHLKELHIEVRFEKENINSLSDEGELMLTLLASFAQEESRSISENIRWSIRKRYKDGKPRISKIYGYRLVNGNLEIVPEQAEVVRKIFEWYLAGDSAYLIAVKLNEEHAPSYTGKPWENNVILQMLRNERFTGNSLLQKYFTPDNINHKQQRNEGQLPMYYVEDSHPAIISKELFDSVQKEMARRAGVGIRNGIAERDAWRDSRNRVAGAETRKVYWSEESRKLRIDKLTDRGKAKILKHDLSLFMKCGVCGDNLVASLRPQERYGSRLFWVCEDHNTNVAAQGIENPGARPLPVPDLIIKQLIAEEMETECFDVQQMEQTFSHLSISGREVTFHYLDGHCTTRTLVLPDDRKKGR